MTIIYGIAGFLFAVAWFLTASYGYYAWTERLKDTMNAKNRLTLPMRLAEVLFLLTVLVAIYGLYKEYKWFYDQSQEAGGMFGAAFRSGIITAVTAIVGFGAFWYISNKLIQSVWSKHTHKNRRI